MCRSTSLPTCLAPGRRDGPRRDGGSTYRPDPTKSVAPANTNRYITNSNMKAKRMTVLEFALLGLVSQKPRTGYELIKVFRDTPMAHYSDSPGAIYPALARLESAGLLRGKTEHVHELRPRREFEPTQRGADELARWLRQRPSQEDVAHRLDEVMLRFAFMDAHLTAAECRAFLRGTRKVPGRPPAGFEEIRSRRRGSDLAARLAGTRSRHHGM